MNDVEAEEKVMAYPLFLGMTRPAMLLGIPFRWAVVLAMASVIGFLVLADFRALLLFPAGYGLAYGLCLKDPRALDVALVAFHPRNRPNAWIAGSKTYVP